MDEIPGLSELKSLTNGNAAIRIAVLDGPVDINHPCFTFPGNNPLPAVENAEPSASKNTALVHGTAVYSLIFGKSGSPVEGIAPGCTGLIIPIYTPQENGGFTSASQVHLAKSIRSAIDQGAHIINISGGQFSKYGEPEFLLKQAIDDCYKAGVLIVAAAGNEGCNCLHVPAADRQVLAVGSMDENGNPTPETNFGGHYRFNGILAPGKNKTAAMAGGTTTFLTNGATSYATPVVSGVVGLLMSLQLKKGMKPDGYAIKSILENTAIPCSADSGIDCKRFLKGKLDLPAAIAVLEREPGIHASGIEFNTGKKNISMSENKIPQMNEVILSSSLEEEEVQPSENQTAITSEAQLPVAEAVLPSENINPIDETIAIVPSSGDTGAADTEIATETPLTLSRDGPLTKPLEKGITISGITESNHIVKKLNMKKMENNTKNQAAEMPGTNETVISSQTPSLAGEITPSDCGCGCNKGGNEGGGDAGNGGASASIVYALGTLGYDFGSEAHRDSFTQSMGGNNPNDPGALLRYIKANPWAAEELTWTLNIDATPIYALYPSGAHSQHGYERIRQYFEQQQNGNIQRISVPGVTHGSTPLLNGQSVDNLLPNLRGMYSWTTEALTAAATGAKGSAKALAENVSNFLNRIYYQMRNLGVSPQDRALNFAATNAYQVSQVFASALKESLELNTIEAEKSPICRPGSDCYDVKLSFFNPKERLTVALKEYRFTVDVSDVVPVTVGEVRSWYAY